MLDLIEPAIQFHQFSLLSGSAFWTEFGGIDINHPDQSVESWDLSDTKNRPDFLQLDDIPYIDGRRSRPIDIFVNLIGPVRGVYTFLRQVGFQREDEVIAMSPKEIFDFIGNLSPSFV